MNGNFNVSEDFAAAKSRQKNVNEDWQSGSHSHVPGQRLPWQYKNKYYSTKVLRYYDTTCCQVYYLVNRSDESKSSTKVGLKSCVVTKLKI